MLRFEMPSGVQIDLHHLVLDLNGTATVNGGVVPGLVDRIARASPHLQVWLLTADTRGTAEGIASGLGAELARIANCGADAEAKKRFVDELGAARVVAIGNGHNDRLMLKAAAVGFAVIQGEGAAASAIRAADAVFLSVCDAIDAILDSRNCIATLRD
jgi:P-type E1-E2 ATPase